jgi:hypothetical protein
MGTPKRQRRKISTAADYFYRSDSFPSTPFFAPLEMRKEDQTRVYRLVSDGYMWIAARPAALGSRCIHLSHQLMNTNL